MKICKKCKKQVTNKSKICKYCGADVSKCKIIKQTPNQNNQKTNNPKPQLKKEEIITKEQEIIVEDTKENKKLKRKSKFNIKEIRKSIEKEKKAYEQKAKTKKEIKEHTIKIIISIICILIILISSLTLITNATKDIFNIEGITEIKENSKKIYNQGSRIKYKDVIYTVTDVYTSQGTEYKKPKEDNEFVVVTIEFENDSNDKVRYSYKDWTMTNSEGEEKNRIFTPINVTTALYSGNLVRGATKTGSIVFEEPIDDDNLVLNYYEYQEEQNEEEEKTPIFSIKIDKKNINKEEN